MPGVATPNILVDFGNSDPGLPGGILVEPMFTGVIVRRCMQVGGFVRVKVVAAVVDVF